MSYNYQINVKLTLTIHSLDIIEVGAPFTDPIADGPTIQKANTVWDKDDEINWE